MMTVSSRTPEGSPSRCPICGKAICLEPSPISDDAPCPHCGCLIWFDVDAQRDVYDLVAETKTRIRDWVSRLTQLSRSPTDPVQYYQAMVRILVLALAAHGGAIWTRRGRSLELRSSVGIGDGGIAEHLLFEPSHSRLLDHAFDEGASFAVPPSRQVQIAEDQGNPTESLLLFSPVKRSAKPIALVEVFQRPGSSTPVQRGYLRFLQQICDLEAAKKLGKSKVVVHEIASIRMFRQTTAAATVVQASIDVAERS